jgi:hypothetical protein
LRSDQGHLGQDQHRSVQSLARHRYECGLCIARRPAAIVRQLKSATETLSARERVALRAMAMTD